MDVQQVKTAIGDVPYMTVRQAERLTDFLREHQLADLLELGYAHGVSTCYLAGALQDMGRGHLTAIDLDLSLERDPNIHALLAATGLCEWVTAITEPTSYTWRLMKMLEQDGTPRFDFCYMDGAHDWFTDGFAFFLVDRLLKPGGWIVFDDLDWSYAESPNMSANPHWRNMPAEELTTRQVRKVYELLVKPHGGYGDFRTDEGWAYARKLPPAAAGQNSQIIREVVVKRERVGVGVLVEKGMRRLVRR